MSEHSPDSAFDPGLRPLEVTAPEHAVSPDEAIHHLGVLAGQVRDTLAAIDAMSDVTAGHVAQLMELAPTFEALSGSMIEQAGRSRRHVRGTMEVTPLAALDFDVITKRLLTLDEFPQQIPDDPAEVQVIELVGPRTISARGYSYEFAEGRDDVLLALFNCVFACRHQLPTMGVLRTMRPFRDCDLGAESSKFIRLVHTLTRDDTSAQKRRLGSGFRIVVGRNVVLAEAAKDEPAEENPGQAVAVELGDLRQYGKAGSVVVRAASREAAVADVVGRARRNTYVDVQGSTPLRRQSKKDTKRPPDVEPVLLDVVVSDVAPEAEPLPASEKPAPASADTAVALPAADSSRESDDGEASAPTEEQPAGEPPQPEASQSPSYNTEGLGKEGMLAEHEIAEVLSRKWGMDLPTFFVKVVIERKDPARAGYRARPLSRTFKGETHIVRHFSAESLTWFEAQLRPYLPALHEREP